MDFDAKSSNFASHKILIDNGMFIIDEKTREYILQYRDEDASKLALKSKPEGVNPMAAMQQIAAYQIAVKKIPLWAENKDIVYPKHLSMEQSSSQNSALFKSKLVCKLFDGKRFSMADLTGGMGVDCSFLACNAFEAHYVDSNAELCELAEHNFATLRKSQKFGFQTEIIVHQSSAEQFIKENRRKFDLIYIDPARRGARGQKLVSISDCQPNVVELLPAMLSASEYMMVKLSPMLDIQKAVGELTNVEHVYIIASGSECKELLLTIKRNSTATEPIITAVEIKSNGSTASFSGLLSTERRLVNDYSAPLKYLYEPNVACLKSGLFKTIGNHFRFKKISQHAHLYTSDECNADFPGRIFTVVEVVQFDKRQMAIISAKYPKANITTRHFPLCADDLHKKYKIATGGNVYLFASTTSDEQKIIIVCKKA